MINLRKLYNSLDNLFWSTYCFFRPPNASIRKVISHKWADADYIIEEVLFATLIRWVEEEDGLFPKLDTLQRDYEKWVKVGAEYTEELLQHFEDNYGGVDNFLDEYHKSYNSYIRLKEAYYWALYGRYDAESKLCELSEDLDLEIKIFGMGYNDEYLNYKNWMEKEHNKHLTTIFELRQWLWT